MHWCLGGASSRVPELTTDDRPTAALHKHHPPIQQAKLAARYAANAVEFIACVGALAGRSARIPEIYYKDHPTVALHKHCPPSSKIAYDFSELRRGRRSVLPVLELWRGVASDFRDNSDATPL